MTTRVPGIEAAYGEGAAVLMNSVVARGGRFEASVFRGSAASYTVGSLEADPTISEARRRRDSAGELAALGSGLGQVLGLIEMTPTVADRMATLPPGSAVGDALRASIESVRALAGERWAVVASDGINNTNGEELPLGSVPRTALILRRAVGQVDASGVNVAMVGIGLSRGKLGSERAGPLSEAWEQVCREIHAAKCEISAQPSLPTVLMEAAS
ncbi:MAG: hypothetical protein ACOYD4_11840 [Solirubrobacterales bacterium]